MMEGPLITSTRNPVIAYVRSLARPWVRREQGVYLAEGVRLVAEALAAGAPAVLALYDPDALQRTEAGAALLSALPAWAERGYRVDERALRSAGQTEHPSGVVAVLRWQQPPPLGAHADDRFGVILDGVSDPGNAGGVLRTAAAAGVRYVAAIRGSADLYAPKVVRAGMGAHFRLDLYAGLSWSELREALPGVALVALVAQAATSIFRFDWPERAALVVGGEAYGVSVQGLKLSDSRVHIPMRAGVESLNAAIAASIAIYTALGPALDD